MKQHRLTLALLCALAAPLNAQSVRSSVVVSDPHLKGAGQSISSRGDITAVAWFEGIPFSFHEPYLSVSDGRGLSFGNPFAPLSGCIAQIGDLKPESVQVGTSRVFLVHRCSSTLPNMSRYLLFTSTKSGNQFFCFSKFLALDAHDFSFDVDPDPSGDHLYVFSCSSTLLGAGGVLLSSSHDGGATFSTIPFGPIGITTESASVAADGTTVHLVWVDNRFQPGVPTNSNVYYQRSVDGGLTFLPVDVQIDERPPGAGGAGSGPREEVAKVAADGDLVAVLWAETPIPGTGTGFRELYVRTSSDGGNTFAPSRLVGSYVPGSVTTYGHALAIEGGEVIVSWQDARTGQDEVYVSTSKTGFSNDVSLGPGFARYDGLTGGNGIASLLFLTVDGAGELIPTVTTSRDGGASWSAPVLVGDTAEGDNTPLLAWNERYGNALVTWEASEVGGPPETRVGGFRPQTVDAVGATAGGQAHFQLSGFSGDEPFAWVFLADTPGFLPLPFGDGRDLGLALDATFLATLAAPSVFVTTLDANGAGATIPFDVSVSAGSSFHLAAVSFGLGPLQIGEITDALPFVVQ